MRLSMFLVAAVFLGCGGEDDTQSPQSGTNTCSGQLPDGTPVSGANGDTLCFGADLQVCEAGTWKLAGAADPSCSGAGGAGGAGGGMMGPNVPPGCERTVAQSACTGAPGITDTVKIDVAGDSRTYQFHVPPQASCSTPSGMLFFFHGLGGNEHQADELEPLADQANFILVQPRGSSQSWAGNALGWVPDGFEENVQFVRDIRTALEQQYAIDPYRVWITGFSQGAFMSAALASPDAIGNEVAGVGVFGGGEEGNTCPNSACYQGLTCKIPFFMRTGDADQHLPFTEDLYDGLVDAGWPEAQLNFETFPGGHTIQGQDFVTMVDWFPGAYPSL